MKQFLCGVFAEEEAIMRAVLAARKATIPIYDVYTPYAIHGLDEAMGIRRSRLPWVCLLAGALGGIFGLTFQSWTSAVNWPLIVGGKPFLAIPAFIPVTFELTVLLGGLATVAAFFWRAGLYPGKKPMTLDLRITDDRFILAIERRDASLDPVVVRKFLQEHGAVEVFQKEVTG